MQVVQSLILIEVIADSAVLHKSAEQTKKHISFLLLQN